MTIKVKQKYVSRRSDDFRIRVHAIQEGQSYAEDRAIVSNITKTGRAVKDTLRVVKVDSIRRKYHPL